MDRLQELLGLSPEEKSSLGVEHTPKEIRQQPDAWQETLRVVQENEDGLIEFLASAGARGSGEAIVLLMGAGSSEYVGGAAEDTLRRGLDTAVTTVPTTTFITHPDEVILKGRRYLFVHLARSGDSPESIASLERARSLFAGSSHLVITCNREGRLALASARSRNTFLLLLPEQTNDRSLVMTSSFSSMTLAVIALAHLGNLDAFRHDVEAAAAAVELLFQNEVDLVRSFAEAPAARIQFLGTGNLFASMKESRLKVLEMTDGMIAANADTYLGVRHGPRVFVSRECAVVASLSTDPSRRSYEVDLLREMRASGQGSRVLAVCDRRAAELDGIADELLPVSRVGASVTQELRPLADVVVGQLIGLFACLARGLKPDAPSRSGVIGRVVPGFAIH